MSAPQISAANAVAAMLNGKTIEGVILSVASDRLLPKYDIADLASLRVDVVPGSEMALARISRGTLTETCPVVVGVQRQCEIVDYAGMIGLVRGIAAEIAKTEIDGFGVPSDDVEFGDDPESVDADGVFRGFVTTTYTAFA